MRVQLLAHVPFAEHLITTAGKLTRGRHSNAFYYDKDAFIKKIIHLGHESLLEFGYAAFLVEGASRVLLSQLSRHRLISLAVVSQRHVKAPKEFVVPETVEGELRERWLRLLDECYALYEEAREKGVPLEDARYILPQSVTTSFVVGANFREWRHILKLRSHRSAQWEFRELCRKIGEILFDLAPSVFAGVVRGGRDEEVGSVSVGVGDDD